MVEFWLNFDQKTVIYFDQKSKKLFFEKLVSKLFYYANPLGGPEEPSIMDLD